VGVQETKGLMDAEGEGLFIQGGWVEWVSGVDVEGMCACITCEESMRVHH